MGLSENMALINKKTSGFIIPFPNKNTMAIFWVSQFHTITMGRPEVGDKFFIIREGNFEVVLGGSFSARDFFATRIWRNLREG